MECGFEEASNEDGCSQECIDSLTANLEVNLACAEADIALYSCLSTTSCEALPLGTRCEPEIDASMSACNSEEPETSSG
ncbi:MAG: hypothetical protein ACRBN8_11070 [Nannocystales bacterium]